MTGFVIGKPLVVATGAGAPHLVALFNTADEAWVEAVSAANGNSIWRSTINRQATASGKPAKPYESSLCSVSGRKVWITVAGSRLLGIDAITGQPAWPAHELAIEPAAAPQVADLDGDGNDDLLLGYLDPTEHRRLTALSLATQQPLWPNPVNVRWEPFWQPQWPFDSYVAALGANGRPAVVMPAQNNESYNSAWTGLEVLDGATGAQRWERHFPIFAGDLANMQRSADRYVAGPDLDDDGQRELFVVSARSDQTERGRDARQPSQYSLFVDAHSGRDGRITARWKTEWGVNGIDGIDPLTKHPLALPRGDLNGDGIADVLFTASHSFFDMDRSRTSVNRPGRLFFPLQAFSGKTGERLWFAQDIPDPVPGNHAYLHVQTYSPICDDLEPGAPGLDIFCPFSCYQLDPGIGSPRRVGIARISGSNGALRWTRMLEDEISLSSGSGGILNDALTPLIATTIVDLNADGVRDVLLTAALRRESGSGGQLSIGGVELIALDGRNGERLWQRPLARRWHVHADPNVSPQPACGDIDGDGRPEVVTVDSGGVGGVYGIWTQYTVTALNGQTGAPKWTWQYTNPSRGGDPVDDSDWPHAVLADLDGDGQPSVCLFIQDRAPSILLSSGVEPSAEAKSHIGSSAAIVVLDGQGNVSARYAGGERLWAGDVDGDGRDELLFVSAGKVIATRGPTDQTLWDWPLPGGDGGILDVRPSERGQPATIVVEAAGQSAIDSLGHAALASFPPDLGIGARGDSIYGLDGATGKPIWTGRRDAIGLVTIPPTSPDGGPALRWSHPTPTLSPVQLPALVSRSGDRTTAQLVLATDDSGKYLAPPVLTRSGPVRQPDPRFMRRLPWVPRFRRLPAWPLAVEFVLPPAYLALYSLVVLAIPGWLLWRGIMRRRWTLRGLLLVPVAVGIGLATVYGLPMLAFPMLLVVWTVRRRWMRVAWLLVAALVLSVAFFATATWVDSRSMDPAEHYSWDGWYLVLIVGCIMASALTLVGMFLARIVRTIGVVMRPAA